MHKDRMDDLSLHQKSSDLITIITAVGSISIVFVFIAMSVSWAFARGMLNYLHFPMSVFTYRNSFDIFASTAIEYSGAFALSLVIGFAPFKFKNNKINNAIIRISFIVLLAIFFPISINKWNKFLEFSLLFGSMFAPVLVGFSLRTAENSMNKWVNTILAIFLSTQMLSVNTYQYGISTGQSLVKGELRSFGDGAMPARRLDEFPFVDIITKEPNLLLASPIIANNQYLYRSEPTNFLRYIFADSDRYYFIKVREGEVMPIAIQKESIISIVFRNIENK